VREEKLKSASAREMFTLIDDRGVDRPHLGTAVLGENGSLKAARKKRGGGENGAVRHPRVRACIGRRRSNGMRVSRGEPLRGNRDVKTGGEKKKEAQGRKDGMASTSDALAEYSNTTFPLPISSRRSFPPSGRGGLNPASNQGLGDKPSSAGVALLIEGHACLSSTPVFREGGPGGKRAMPLSTKGEYRHKRVIRVGLNKGEERYELTLRRR